jgi:hypothetical protein
MSGSNVVQLPVPEREDPRMVERRVWLRIFAAEETLRQFPLIMRCRILAYACAEQRELDYIAAYFAAFPEEPDEKEMRP